MKESKKIAIFFVGLFQSLLDDSTGSIPASDAQLTKFHGTYLQDDRDKRMSLIKEKKEKAFSFMIRVRVPGGVCTPKQWIGIDDLSDKFADGTFEVDYSSSIPTSRNPQTEPEANNEGDK